MKSKKKDDILEKDKEVLEMFQNVEVIIPLLDAIKQVPRYAKFLKELCTNKRRLQGREKVNMGQNVLALIQPLPQKCKDPSTFTIPYIIGNQKFDEALLDLGSLINVMPLLMFIELDLGPLKGTELVFQLANRSNAYPLKIVEDVLVQLGKLIFPADFYILEMEGETQSSCSPLIFGRPFLKMAQTKIDVHSKVLLMEFGNSIIQFNILKAMKHPSEDHSLFHIKLIKDLVEEVQLELEKEFPKIAHCNDSLTCDMTLFEGQGAQESAEFEQKKEVPLSPEQLE